MRVLAAFVVFSALLADSSTRGLGYGQGSTVAVQGRTLSGTVTDPAGGPLPGVAVELRQGPQVVRRTTTDNTGMWKFEKVPAGEFQVRLALAGFVTTEVRLKVGDVDPAPVRVVLKVGAVSETVTVVHPTPAVVDSQSAARAVPGVCWGAWLVAFPMLLLRRGQ